MQGPVNHSSKIVGFLAGPTASGKSALAVEICLRRNLAIISGDSMQVYRGLEVGTGVIPEQERKGVPHYLLSIADPQEEFHAARFIREANAAAEEEFAATGKRSLVVGGTGLWIRALREGLFDGPGRDEQLREELRRFVAEKGEATLHAELQAVDKESAERLSPADVVRVSRAIEVFRLTGRTMTEWQEEDRARREALGPLVPLLVIQRDREELITRINARVDEMLQTGWIDEARWLKSLELPSHFPARKALGYPVLFDYLDGKIDLLQAAELIKIQTRQYARAQMTWFRSQREITFLPPDADEIEAKLFV